MKALIITVILAFSVALGCLMMKVVDGEAMIDITPDEIGSAITQEHFEVDTSKPKIEWFSYCSDFEFEVGSSRIIRFGLREDGVVVWRAVDPNKKAGI